MSDDKSNPLTSIVEALNRGVRDSQTPNHKLKKMTLNDGVISITANPRALSGAEKIWGVKGDQDVDSSTKGRDDVYVPAFGFYASKVDFEALCSHASVKKTLAQTLRAAAITRNTYLDNSQVLSHVGTVRLNGSSLELDSKTSTERRPCRDLVSSARASRTKDHMAEAIKMVKSYSANCPPFSILDPKKKHLEQTKANPRRNTNLLEMIEIHRKAGKFSDISNLDVSFKTPDQPAFSGITPKKMRDGGRVISNMKFDQDGWVRVTNARVKNPETKAFTVDKKRRDAAIKGIAIYLAFNRHSESGEAFTQDLVDRYMREAATRFETTVDAFERERDQQTEKKKNTTTKSTTSKKAAEKKPSKTSRSKSVPPPVKAKKPSHDDDDMSEEEVVSPAASQSSRVSSRSVSRGRTSPPSDSRKDVTTPIGGDSSDDDEQVGMSRPRSSTPKSRIDSIRGRHK